MEIRSPRRFGPLTLGDEQRLLMPDCAQFLRFVPREDWLPLKSSSLGTECRSLTGTELPAPCALRVAVVPKGVAMHEDPQVVLSVIRHYPAA